MSRLQRAASIAHAAPLLVRTKLAVPLPRPNVVHRPRLLAQLEAGLRRPLTMIVAPAGFGKTTLLSEWRVSSPGLSLPVAWVSLDRGDNDPIRFWSYVIAALDDLQPGVGTAALSVLQSPQHPKVETVLAMLLNALAALPAEAGLVLDDYHVINAPAVHHAMGFFLEHLPPQLHVIIATRSDPPLPLSRLRAADALSELRATDLRFTLEEVAAFLNDGMGLSLDPRSVVALGERTEGWIAGLQLAALSLRGRLPEQVGDFVEEFTGSNRFVMDYLVDEVFRLQPLPIQTFLLHTSVLERMCAPLCDALIGGRGTGDEEQGAADPRPPTSVPSPQEILEQLERANLFVVPLDDERRWYRYHHLFADVLRNRLLQSNPSVIQSLHRSASTWFEGEGLVLEAVAHALAAPDHSLAAQLIERHGAATVVRGRIDTVLNWFKALPEELVRSRPRLSITYAGPLMFTNQPEQAEIHLRDAERWCNQEGVPAQEARTVRGLAALTRGSLVRFSGDLAVCAALGREALELVPEDEPFWRAIAKLNAAYDFLVTGDVRPSSQRLVVEALDGARAAGHLFAVLRGIILLARLQVLQGRLGKAAATYGEVLQISPGQEGLHGLVGSPGYYFGMGDLLREWNDLDGAEHLVSHGVELVAGTLTVDADTLLLGNTTLARIRLARGDTNGAMEVMESFLREARERGVVPSILARGAAMRAHVALEKGSHLEAATWVKAANLRAEDCLDFPREDEYLTLARARIAQGGDNPGGLLLASVVQMLDRMLEAAEASERSGSAIKILILLARAFQTQGDEASALSSLVRALTLAQPEGYVRVFVDEGAPMVGLLKVLSHRHPPLDSGLSAYVGRLLAAFPQVHARQITPSTSAFSSWSGTKFPELVPPLTSRETEVLRLIAAGASNREIAETLVVSVGTVKKHGNNIFGKLGVESRTQAVARATALNLI